MFYAFINYFRKLLKIFLGVIFRHKLKHLLAGVPRKTVLLKFENVKRAEGY